MSSEPSSLRCYRYYQQLCRVISVDISLHDVYSVTPRIAIIILTAILYY